jgi:hypothetical protein
MATAEERMKILEMVQTGVINSDEGAHLLQALQTDKASNGADARWLRIRITDVKTKQAKININIPMSLVNSASFNALRYLAENTTWQQQKNG